MVLHFIINYVSAWQEEVYICGNVPQLGNNIEANAIPLTYINDTSWACTIDIENTQNNVVTYYYFVKKADGTFAYHACNFEIQLKLASATQSIVDTWVSVAAIPSVFEKKIFSEVFFNKKNDVLNGIVQGNVHIAVKMPVELKKHHIGLLGKGKRLGNWEQTNYLQPVYNNGNYCFELTVDTNETLEYKYVLIDKVSSEITYENGDNRVVNIIADTDTTINDGYVNIEMPEFKGAGVAIPVFSLRSANSFGVGEFTDIEKLVDWCSKVGIKLIQLLPINDTIATKTNKDSYPYAANSAFALHPMYINLHKVGVLPTTNALEKKYASLQQELESKATLDFENVIAYKLDYLKELYTVSAASFKNDDNYILFYQKNKNWLDYYAVYSFLRDKHNTVDFTLWKGYEEIDTAKINNLLSEKNDDLQEIDFWFFVQYHLHLQLSNVVAYGHSKGVAFKGDLPIGIGRTSCDAWQHPNLFNMQMQAGAPPDDFAVKGQNWGFPTYNWKAMQQDGYQWWKDRFAKMSDYFDAFRIDHILGFFRIWSIPVNAIDGILGNFVPALAVHENEFLANHVYLDKERFTKPHFTQQQLEQLFGEAVEGVKAHFFEIRYGMFVLQSSFNTQLKIKNYATEFEKDWTPEIINTLIDCCNNIILIEEPGSNGTQFHFNIAMEKTMSYQLLSPSHQQQLKQLFINYFYERQDEFWEKEAMQKLPILQRTTNMLICGEDLGMVPNCVPGVMQQMNMLSLEVQRMPKASGAQFVDLNQVPYLSVCTPSTHDMSTIRGWWEEDRNISQRFYNDVLAHYGTAPFYCESWLSLEIIKMHLASRSMWAMFQLQDLMSIENVLRIENPNDERINVPADPNHYWCYRMHVNLESLLLETQFNTDLYALIKQSNRCN